MKLTQKQDWPHYYAIQDPNGIWIYDSLSPYKKVCIVAFVELHNECKLPRHIKTWRQLHRMGYTCEKVNITRVQS